MQRFATESEAVSIPVRPLQRKPYSLAPREHGAYGQLMLPLVAALGMSKPTAAALALCVASVAVFFAHEPLLILLGRRGRRAHQEMGARATRRLLFLGVLAGLHFAAWLALAPKGAIVALSIPTLLAFAVAVAIVRGVERTAVGELLASAALSGVAVPVALSSAVAPAVAWGAWGIWCVAFSATTFAVRTVIAHGRTPVPWPRRVAAPSLAAIAVAVPLFARVLPTFEAFAALPMLVASIGLTVAPPRPKALKRVGWTLVGASVAVTCVLVIGARL